MKRKLAILLIALMTVSITGCSKKEAAEGNNSVQETVKIDAEDSLDLINTVWSNYDEANKFAVGGGDSANLNFEGPGAFDISVTDELDATLGFPTAQAEKIDNAASMMNAMMANNFTAGVYHLKDAASKDEVAGAIKENIMSRQWMCGMPEKMVVISAGDYIISAFGLADVIDTFKAEVVETYDVSEVLFEESIS